MELCFERFGRHTKVRPGTRPPWSRSSSIATWSSGDTNCWTSLSSCFESCKAGPERPIRRVCTTSSASPDELRVRRKISEVGANPQLEMGHTPKKHTIFHTTTMPFSSSSSPSSSSSVSFAQAATAALSVPKRKSPSSGDDVVSQRP